MKWYLLFIISFFFLFSLVFAQDTVLLHYSRSITKEELSAHVFKLASDEMEGRFTGSRGLMRAQKYIIDEFGQYGIEMPVFGGKETFKQEFTLNECRWRDQRMSIDGEEFKVGKDFLFLSDPVDFKGDYPVVFAGFGIEDPAYNDFGNIDVKGKIMLAFASEPKNSQGIFYLTGKKEPSKKAYHFTKEKMAADKGAEGVFIISRNRSDYRKYLKSRGYYDPKPKITYPGKDDDVIKHKAAFAAYMNVKTAARLVNQKPKMLLQALHDMEDSLKTTAGRFNGSVSITASSDCYSVETANVIGIIEGTDLKSQAVIVVAHYDHLGMWKGDIYHGADDNASGTAALMELAEAFGEAAQNGIRPRRTIIFIAATAEELGLYGSKFYTQNPLFPLDSTYACVNIDMIGRVPAKLADSPDYIGGSVYLSTELLTVSQESCKLMAPGLEDHIEYKKSLRGGSDHYYFSKNGIPSVFYFEGFHPDYHEPTDTANKLLYDRMEQIVRVIFATTWELANREEIMKNE